MGINTHTKLGNPDLVLYDSADYFVAAPNFRDSLDDSRALYRTHTFEPVRTRRPHHGIECVTAAHLCNEWAAFFLYPAPAPPTRTTIPSSKGSIILC